MIEVKEESDGSFTIFWDENDPIESQLNTWTKQDFIDAIMNSIPENKQKTWTLPVEEVKIEDTDEVEYMVTFPQDMLDHTGWVEGDILEWIDNGDGSFTLKRRENTNHGNV